MVDRDERPRNGGDEHDNERAEVGADGGERVDVAAGITRQGHR